MKNNTSGHLAEILARCFFRLKGYRIVAVNYVTGKGTHAGEVDFIARCGKNLVFVEVKKRTSIENAAYAISESQKQRIVNGAQAFLKKHPYYQDYNIRFDALLVKLPLTLRHISNAWN